MQRISIPIFFNTVYAQEQTKMGINVPDSDLAIRNAWIFTDKIISFYPRIVDDKPAGVTIESVSSIFHSPLRPEEFDDRLKTLETDEFIRDLNNAGLSGLADLVPGTFNEEINNMMNPNDPGRKDPK